jgi:hypothetical protein
MELIMAMISFLIGILILIIILFAYFRNLEK